MKSVFLVLVASALATPVSAMVGFDNTPSVVPTQLAKAYVPEGFDDNDNVQFVAEGVFKNGCYRFAKMAVDVDDTHHTIKLTPTAYKYTGACLMVLLPFDRVVDVGLLKQGTYTVVLQPNEQDLGRIDVAAAKTADADDYLYAPISQAYFKTGVDGKKILMSGNFPTSCMKLQTVQVHQQKDVLVIQPIAEIDASVKCEDGQFPFETAVDVSDLKKGRYLIHVRSLNGKAVNNLVDVP